MRRFYKLWFFGLKLPYGSGWLGVVTACERSYVSWGDEVLLCEKVETIGFSCGWNVTVRGIGVATTSRQSEGRVVIGMKGTMEMEAVPYSIIGSWLPEA